MLASKSVVSGRRGHAVVRVLGIVLIGGLAAMAGQAALALDEKKDEKEKLKACEVTLCTLVTKKAPADGDFACHLSKTWAKDKIKEGSASGKVSWGFGDARCSVDVKLPRSAVIGVLGSISCSSSTSR